jgi:hypothetical protein
MAGLFICSTFGGFGSLFGMQENPLAKTKRRKPQDGSLHVVSCLNS